MNNNRNNYSPERFNNLVKSRLWPNSANRKEKKTVLQTCSVWMGSFFKRWTNGQSWRKENLLG